MSMDNIFFNPIIPIWLMSIICLIIIVFVRRSFWAGFRQILIALLLFVINLRPMIPGESFDVQKQEMNTYVLFAIDDTISMLAEDYDENKTRLDAIKADCGYIVDSLPGAHFEVIEFHNSAVILSPYTDNGMHIKNAINSIYPPETYYAEGSNPSIVKDAMLESLKEVNKRGDINVAVFFISDGEITNGEDLESFSKLADYIDEGAVLGYGTEDGGQMRYQGQFDDEPKLLTTYNDNFDEVPAISYIDEHNLRRVAADMDIKYIHMTNQSKVDSVIEEIIEKSDVVTSTIDGGAGYKVERSEDIYFWFVIPLFILLLFEAVSVLRERIGLKKIK